MHLTDHFGWDPGWTSDGISPLPTNPTPKQRQPVAKVARTRRVKKPKTIKKEVKKASNTSIAVHAHKYEFLPELANTFCDRTFRQLFRGDAADAKKEMEKLFSNLSAANVCLVEEDRERRRRLLKKILVNAYGTEGRH